MPFYYDVKVPELPVGGKYKFVKWVLSGKSNIEANTELAIVSSGETQYVLRNAGPGFFTPWNVQVAEEVSPGQVIGRIVTDGELIPYGRPYVTFSELPQDHS
jgi:hypothetical protein